MLTDILRRIYPVGTKVQYKAFQEDYWHLGTVNGYNETTGSLQIAGWEFPGFGNRLVPRQWIRAYYSKEAVDKLLLWED